MGWRSEINSDASGDAGIAYVFMAILALGVIASACVGILAGIGFGSWVAGVVVGLIPPGLAYLWFNR